MADSSDEEMEKETFEDEGILCLLSLPGLSKFTPTIGQGLH